MHNLKAILAILSVSFLSSCIAGDFDDLAGEIYVQSDGKGNIGGSDFGIALIPTGGTEGLNYYVVTAGNGATVEKSSDGVALVHVNFDDKGVRTTSPAQFLLDPGFYPGLPRLIDRPAVASDRSSFADPTQARVALGIIHGTDAKVVLMDAIYDDEATAPPRLLPAIGVEGNQAPTSIAFGTSNATFNTDDTVDLMAISGGRLNLIADYQSTNPSVGDCALQTGGGQLLLADVDPNSAGDEVILADENRVFVAAVADIQARMTMEMNCGVGVEIGTEVTPPTGTRKFGDSLAIGNFGGTAQPDLVVADPGSNSVYVYFDWTPGSPTTATRISTPSDSVAFGKAIAVGDFDGDGTDELVVSDPEKKIGDHNMAGSAYIYESDAAGGFLPARYLHDSRAQDEQLFGRSLAVAPGFGSDRLIVGADDEVFTYFETPMSGDADFRQ